MKALFSPRQGRIFRWALALAPGGVLAAAALLFGVALPRARADVGAEAPPQPMWFDHRHHVGGFGIDCRYCHAAVERSPSAGIPATEVCVGCHTPTWLGSAYFEPVRASMADGSPIPWRRVHDLPDFVFFDHSAHVNNGVGCQTCHGRVDRMALVRQVRPLTMSWCVECHRDPLPHLRPPDRITTMGWTPASPEASAELQELYRVRGARALTTCTVCHR